KAGPVAINQGVNVEQGVHEEEEHAEAAYADDQGLDDVMEEINRFDSSALPNQQQQSGGPTPILSTSLLRFSIT
ncbi:hypothetical protein A2U01_0104161, partial [Trifolium medium]|nr:hypothetical protein [Trifolium medium]